MKGDKAPPSTMSSRREKNEGKSRGNNKNQMPLPLDPYAWLYIKIVTDRNIGRLIHREMFLLDILI